MPWEQLGIEPTQDSRAIKRAYAQRLKQNRPDDNPEGFQRLHQAYKFALQLAEAGYVDDDVRLDAALSDEAPAQQQRSSTGNQPLPKQTEMPFTAAVDTSSKNENDDLKDALLHQCQQCLQSSAGLSRPEEWQFLINTPALLDDDFNHALGLDIFACITDKASASGVKPHGDVLRYLDSLFNWKGKRSRLYRQFGEEACEWLFALLDQVPSDRDVMRGVRGGDLRHSKEAQPQQEATSLAYAGYGIRTLAFLLDIFFVMFAIGLLLVGPINLYTGAQTLSDFWIMAGSPAGYLLLTLMMECTPLQGSPGKYLLGLKVVNRYGDRLAVWHNVLRVLAFMATGLLWKVIFIVNAFMKGRLLHDRISRSFVISPSS